MEASKKIAMLYLKKQYEGSSLLTTQSCRTLTLTYRSGSKTMICSSGELASKAHLVPHFKKASTSAC